MTDVMHPDAVSLAPVTEVPAPREADGAMIRVVSSFGLSFLLGLALLSLLVLAAGFWNVIANTRALAALIAAGFIPLGEDDPGFGTGVPAVNLWIRSQELVTWPLVLFAAALFIAAAVLKGFQFHRITRFVGVEGTFGQHFRVFIYGHSLGRMLPYRIGEVAWASALEGQGGASLEKATKVAFTFKGFLLFELVTFAIIGLLMSDLLTWATALVPPFAILGAAWLLARPPRDERTPLAVKWQRAKEIIFELSRDPRMLTGLMFLSLLSFLLIEIASYIVPQAFTTPVTLLIQNELRIVVVTAPIVVMAVVAGYIARLVPVTPGGIGQFEWAFALVLTIGGLPLSSAVVLALLVSAVRYFTGSLLFVGTLLTYGFDSNLQRVLALFNRTPVRPIEETTR